MGEMETIKLSEAGEYLKRRYAEEKQREAEELAQPPADPGPPPTNDPHVNRLIAEGKAKPPKRRREGPFKRLRPGGEVDYEERASKALEYVRGYR
jgi:hypothetical protein